MPGGQEWPIALSLTPRRKDAKGFYKYNSLRLCGFAALRLCGFAALRLCGFAALRVRE
jgi:hypothetical protein